MCIRDRCGNERCPLLSYNGRKEDLFLQVRNCPGCKILYCSDNCRLTDWNDKHQFICRAKGNQIDESFSEGSQRSRKASIDDYEFINDKNCPVELGRGAYGYVKLVRERATGDVFALKVVSY
eukprot:TRINITY_DN7895_c0_g1_i2.p1 TRINITY_DN7895_c0_g1~~TRINITY_DN7895_c0_g1_i2.p1  ORF type:complete len:122 (-),score=17.66 TRINITY_DN7895_c0_g1_i2:176-541(-)